MLRFWRGVGELADRQVEKYCDLFVHRRDAFAVQLEHGGYCHIGHPVTSPLIRAHLEGKVSLGLYALAQDETARWAVFDSDAEGGLSDLQTLCVELHQLGIPSYLEDSRRGGHLWLFLKPMAAQAVYYFSHWLLKRTGFEKRVELLPKQVKLGPGGVGSLIRAPLGIHRISHKRHGFVGPLTRKTVAWALIDQLEYLETFERVPSRRVAELLAEAVAYHYAKKPKRNDP